MSFLHRTRRWLYALSHDQTDAPSHMVMLTTKSGTTARGLLVGRYTRHFVFAPGASVMANGSTQWRKSDGHLEIPREQVDYFFIE